MSHIGGNDRDTCMDPLNCRLCYPDPYTPIARRITAPASARGIDKAQTVEGTKSRIYIDREHVKEQQAQARPWVVENERGKFRCAQIVRLTDAVSCFDVTAKPALWLTTYGSVQMYNVEVLP